MQDLIEDAKTALKECKDLRVLRLPCLNAYLPEILQDLEVQLPNCLIVEARGSCIDEGVPHTARC